MASYAKRNKQLAEMDIEALRSALPALAVQSTKGLSAFLRRISEYDRVEDMRKFDEMFPAVAGVDEAGRGPLAGPVYAAAVILPQGLVIEGMNDSKKLSKQKRDALFEIIIKEAIAYGIASEDNDVIDNINIRNATFRAMNKAISLLSPVPQHVLIDGNDVEGLLLPHHCVVKGDMKSQSIAAASILAKVSRDRYIEEMATLYPMYALEEHKGYGTKRHIDMIQKYGPCPIHRMSFLKNILS